MREECVGPILRLFSDSHKGYKEERERSALREPSLFEMTEAAIGKLSKSIKFFLDVCFWVP